MQKIILHDLVEPVAFQRRLIAGERFIRNKTLSIKTVDAVPGAKPHKTFAVLKNTGDNIVRKTFFCRIVLDLTLWLGKKGSYSKQLKSKQVKTIWRNPVHITNENIQFTCKVYLFYVTLSGLESKEQSWVLKSDFECLMGFMPKIYDIANELIVCY